MTKNELIKALEKIPGNPDVVVEYIENTRSGPLVKDWLDVRGIDYDYTQNDSHDVILEVVV